ncbi:MAG: NADH-quinone oxidoreductase subunit K [Anaerolineae bacterium]|nr:NADH-quinone oxidoreductase subunit K [Anaerolineae bacterium]
MSDTTVVLVGAFALLGLGWYGLMTTRHLMKMIAILQIMVKAVLLLLIAAGNASGQPSLAQSLAVGVIVADTMVTVVALALAVQLYQHCQTMDIREFARLKG